MVQTQVKLTQHNMQDFPTYISSFVKRFTTGSYASVSSSAAADNDTIAALVRDEFGFRQLIIVATNRGVVYAISSGDGTVVWRRILSFGWAAEVGARHVPLKLFVTRLANDGDTPKIVLVSQRLADNVCSLSKSMLSVYLKISQGTY